MTSLILILCFVTGLIAYFVSNAFRRPPNFPPGPPSLPIYGAFMIIRAFGNRDLGKACWRLANRYKTKVLGFYLSVVPCAVITDPNLMKEMLTREEFDGRLDLILARLRCYWKSLGLFFTDGYFWFVQRRFAFKVMRDYGFGKRDAALEDVTTCEIKEMIDMVLTGPSHAAEKDIVKGDLVNIQYFVSIPFINSLLYVIRRMTIPRADYRLLWNVQKHATMFQRGSDDLGGALSLTPKLKDLAPGLSGFDQLFKGNMGILDFCTKIIEKVVKTHDESYDRHFLDVYLKKMKEELRENDKTTFSVDQLKLICTDFMLPTATGPQSLLTMLVEHTLLQPEIQDKIHEEIDRVVGRDRLPTLDDRYNMPYTEACIREAMRYDTLLPLGVPHRTCKDTSIGGYDLPENTLVANNYVMLNFDKDIWGDPENFRPERFIENGVINLAKDKSLPFGAGRRLCPGETYARQTTFLVFAGLMQAFRVSTADGKPHTKPVERIQGIVTTMPDMWVRLTPRITMM